MLLSLILLVNSCYPTTTIAIQEPENELYITSYNCQNNKIITKSLTQTIKDANALNKISFNSSTEGNISSITNEDEINPRTVFNKDEWIKVSPRDPRIAYIRTYWKDGGSNTRGTAFFISNDTVVTSAHCIYNASRGGWCDYADIFPAKNESDQPYGQISSDIIHLLTSYIESPSVNNDYAIIELERAKNHNGYFGWNTSATTGQYIKIMGYPSCLVNNPASTTAPIIKQYYDTGTIGSVYTGYIKTTNTNTNGGSSGGPVLNSNNQAIAIVKGHNSSSNSATRVDSYAAQWFSTFR